MLTEKYLNIIQGRREGLRRDLAPLFPGPAERDFTWEVGCGHGHYLTDYAAAHPAERCVGIDLLADRIVRANRKRDRAGRPNLHFLQAEARLFLSEGARVAHQALPAVEIQKAAPTTTAAAPVAMPIHARAVLVARP